MVNVKNEKYPGLEFEKEVPQEVFPTEEQVLESNNAFMLGSTVTLEGMEQPAPRVVDAVDDEYANLPAAVQAEILAGREAIARSEARSGHEMSAGAILAAAARKRSIIESSMAVKELSINKNEKPEEPLDMYGRGKSGLTFKTGYVESTTVKGDPHPTNKATFKSNYQEGNVEKSEEL